MWTQTQTMCAYTPSLKKIIIFIKSTTQTTTSAIVSDMSKPNVRIKDIALLAGVSEGTVDRVLHNRGKVSKEAAERIMKVLSSNNYKPNLIARTLGANRAYRIAAMIPDPQLDPYWTQSSQGLTLASEEWIQYGVTLELHYFNHHDKNSFLQTSLSVFHSKPDGVLAAPLFYYAAVPFFKVLKENGIPFVLVNTLIPQAEPLNFIGQNSFQSGQLAGELLYYGHRGPSAYAIVHIHEDLDNSPHLTEKENGFKAFFGNLRNQDNEVLTISLGNPDSEEFNKQLEQLVSMPSLKGIFVSTSKAFYIASALEKLERKDIRLVGYDLIEKNLHYLKAGRINALINQNPKRQAIVGVNNLANYLVFKKEMPGMNLFPLEIITRQNLESYLSSDIH